VTSEVIRYRNANNGDVVKRQHPDARLEMLPNWERLASGEKPYPDRSASKDEWQAYAQMRAGSDEERAEIPTLTKAVLIERYGEDPTV